MTLFTKDELDLLESRMTHDIQRLDKFVDEHDLKSDVSRNMVKNAKMRRERLIRKIQMTRNEIH